ncbi:MAG: DUF5908 family protein [Crocinitomicaceae bacterium]|nr:DUF5908 family protein [Crocinitomicaceae bacterium]
MPLEILEIQVTASVTESGGNAGPSPAEGMKKEDVVAECVERVLEILKEKQEH